MFLRLMYVIKNYACRSKRVFRTEARDEAVVGYSMKHKYPCRTRVTVRSGEGFRVVSFILRSLASQKRKYSSSPSPVSKL